MCLEGFVGEEDPYPRKRKKPATQGERIAAWIHALTFAWAHGIHARNDSHGPYTTDTHWFFSLGKRSSTTPSPFDPPTASHSIPV